MSRKLWLDDIPDDLKALAPRDRRKEAVSRDEESGGASFSKTVLPLKLATKLKVYSMEHSSPLKVS